MSAPTERTGVAILGATGLVGERLVSLLQDHPWFRLEEVVASDASAGLRLGDLIEGAGPSADLEVQSCGSELESSVLLSALPGEAALEFEALYTRRGHLVCSNAAAYRDDPSVPLVVPEVNSESLSESAPSVGRIVTNPNCVVSGLAVALVPLQARFGITGLTVVTLQALSGAGRRGLGAWDTQANVIPHIDGEAEKIGRELRRVFGWTFLPSVRVNRVPVIEGHLATVFLKLDGQPAVDEVAEVLADFRPPPPIADLPSSPPRPIRVMHPPDRPQPRLDAGLSGGMGVSVGGIRADSAYDVSFSVLSHNLVRGAAGACLLNAELAVQLQRGVRS